MVRALDGIPVAIGAPRGPIRFVALLEEPIGGVLLPILYPFTTATGLSLATFFDRPISSHTSITSSTFL
jgi:hypothetical protein